MASSSAASSVFYYQNNTYDATKAGTFIYNGDAVSFYEWEFRTKSKVLGKKDKEYQDCVGKIIEGLRGDAFVVAQELGLRELSHDDGIDSLIKAMRAMVFPLTTHEAKELFRLFTKTRGPLSRQQGESMTQYVSRRKRCWKLLKELDPDIELSEGHRADMLLDLAGLDKNERTMIQASINNDRSFAKVADALVCQHPRAHLNEKKKTSVLGTQKKYLISLLFSNTIHIRNVF